MKQIISLVILLHLATNVFTQQIKETRPARNQWTQDEYKKRSEGDLVGGIVLVGAGTGMIILGKSLQKNATGWDISGIVVEALGIVAIGGSIPLFIASAHNHRKAKQLAVTIKPENTLAVRQFLFTRQLFPAVSIKINL